MSKRIVLTDAFGFELFSGESLLSEPPKAAPESTEEVEDARQGGPLESGIFFRGTPRLEKTGLEKGVTKKDPRAA